MEDEWTAWIGKRLLGICCGWRIEYKYKTWYDAKTDTYNATVSDLYATKDGETVTLQSPSYEEMIKLICMREGVPYGSDSIRVIPTP